MAFIVFETSVGEPFDAKHRFLVETL